MSSSIPQQASSDYNEKFLQILSTIEKHILDFYEIGTVLPAKDFLLSKDHISPHLQIESQGNNTPKIDPRAAVCTYHDPEHDELFLGVYFEPKLVNKIELNNPLLELGQNNIDAFCVLVEEISHFHLICQRALQNRQVSQLELEWQGEVDKFLLSAMTLFQQSGNPHFKHLQHIIYDSGQLLQQTERYEEANRLAARFWLQIIDQGIGKTVSFEDKGFKAFMRENYHRPLQEKIPFISSMKKVI